MDRRALARPHKTAQAPTLQSQALRGTIAGMNSSLMQEIAVAAATLVVDEGLEYGPAKRQALKQLRLSPRTALPDNLMVEEAVREHLALVHADTQPAQLQALRDLALDWMQRLSEFTPHIGGAVWHGTATEHSDIYLQLFCDDPKAVEIALINRNVDYDARTVRGLHGHEVEALSLRSRCEPLQTWVGVHLLVNDRDDFRGALLPDEAGRKPRGDAQALAALMAQERVA